VRLFVSSDWHLDWHTDGYERFGDVKNAVANVVQACMRAEKVRPDCGPKDEPVFVFLGDLTNPYSRNVHRAMAYAADVACELSDAGIHNVWLVGNHDVIEDGHCSHTLLSLKSARFQYTTVIDKPSTVTICNKVIAGLPFTPIAGSYDPEEFIESLPNADVIIGHLHIDGVILGSETEAMPRGRSIRFPLEAARRRFPEAVLLNGHYHNQQTVGGIHIPGSLARLTHGEERNEPGFLVVKV